MTKLTSPGRNRFVYVVLGVNAALWVIQWYGFFSRSTPYPTVRIPNEGPYIWQVIAHRAVSPDIALSRYASYQAAFIPNLPSFLVTTVIFNAIFAGQRSPELYLGTTVGGYELVSSMLVSFFQWYLFARLLIWLGKKVKHSRGSQLRSGSVSGLQSGTPR
jgi:hypothetical protein